MLQLFQHMFLISPVYDTRHNLLSSPLHSDISSFNLYRVLWKTAQMRHNETKQSNYENQSSPTKKTIKEIKTENR